MSAQAAGAAGVAPPLPPGRFHALAGRGRTFYREIPGPPRAPVLLLLHGLVATADLNWFTSYDTLGRHFRVIAIDQRGHGRGIRSRTTFRLEQCADDAAELVRALGIDRVVSVGYSMGGPVAQLMWRRHPDLVRGLVLCATSRNFAGSPQERFMWGALVPAAAAVRLAPPAITRAASRMLAGRIPSSPLRAWAMNELALASPRAMVEAAAALGRFSSHAWIGEVDVPTACVVTMQDTLVPPHRQLKLANGIPNARVFPVELDHAAPASPRLFVPVLLDACRAVTG